MSYIYGFFTHKGGRKKNEDCILIREARIGLNEICFGIVCDGVGGLRKGEIASNFAVKFMSDWFERMALKSSYEIDYDYLKKSMIKNIHKVNVKISEYGSRHGIRCATTLSAFMLYNERFFALNVGDSRIYICSNGLHQLTTDDAADDGRLTQCVGAGNEITVNSDEGILRNNEALFICSDGFYNSMSAERVLKMLGQTAAESAQNDVKQMVCESVKRCADDNASAGFVIYRQIKRRKTETYSFVKSIIPFIKLKKIKGKGLH